MTTTDHTKTSGVQELPACGDVAMVIGGEFVGAVGGQWTDVVSPGSLTVIGRVPSEVTPIRRTPRARGPMVSDTPDSVEGLQQPVQQRALDDGVRTGMGANTVLALTCDYD